MTGTEQAGQCTVMTDDVLDSMQKGNLEDSEDQPVKVIPRDATVAFSGYFTREKFFWGQNPKQLGELLGVRTRFSSGVYLVAPQRPLLPGEAASRAYSTLPEGREYEKQGAERDRDEFPPGTGAPQWKMMLTLPARILAEFGPNENYSRVRSPLARMVIRTAELDRGAPQAGVSSRLNAPIGGAHGMVRSAGTKKHAGWDLYAEVGTSVYSVTWGEVERAVSTEDRTQKGYGNYVLVRLLSRHGRKIAKEEGVDAVYALYAHLSAVDVKAGDPVWLGRKLGLSGKTGNAYNTPPHLHFGLRTSPWENAGNTLDPGRLVGFGYYICDKGQTANPYLR
jgi:murein DD-endopeptidase MepM/ murein hydrolase activator NlpD